MPRWFRSHALLALWGLGLVLVYVAFGWFGARAVQRSRIETQQSRRWFLQTAAFGLDVRALEEHGTPVTIGVFVERIGELEPHTGEWTADFDVWFRWRNEQLHPGETFEVVNGEVAKREKVESIDANGERYERWRVHAKLATSVDAARYPFGDEAFGIQIEDGQREATQMHYVADTGASGVGFTAPSESIVIKQSLAMAKYVEYSSSLGRPTTDAHEVRSRFVFAMIGAPASLPTHLKNFQALYASVAIALLVFFIRPIHVDPRFGLGVGAAFAAVTNNVAVTAAVPSVPGLTLTTLVNGIGLTTIFLTMVESCISLYLLDTLGLEKLYRQLDKLSFWIILVGYVTLNIVFPFASRG
jgi:hypothetical protein